MNATQTPDQPYRTIGLTGVQLQRLPMWARLGFARADATIIRREDALRAIADTKVAADTDYKELCALLVAIAAISLKGNDAPYGALEAAIAKAEGRQA